MERNTRKTVEKTGVEKGVFRFAGMRGKTGGAGKMRKVMGKSGTKVEAGPFTDGMGEEELGKGRKGRREQVVLRAVLHELEDIS